MNDVLPKPFTKEGLMAVLDRNLGHLKKQTQANPNRVSRRSQTHMRESALTRFARTKTHLGNHRRL